MAEPLCISAKCWHRAPIASPTKKLPGDLKEWKNSFVFRSSPAASILSRSSAVAVILSTLPARTSERTFSCSYDTARQRDEAIDKLYGKYSKLDAEQPFSIDYINSRYVLNDASGNAIAHLHIEPREANQPFPREEAYEVLRFCR